MRCAGKSYKEPILLIKTWKIQISYIKNSNNSNKNCLLFGSLKKIAGNMKNFEKFTISGAHCVLRVKKPVSFEIQELSTFG